MEITILILLILTGVAIVVHTVSTRNTINELRSDIDRLENITRECNEQSRRDRQAADSQSRLENNEQFRLMSETIGRNVDALAQSQKIQLQLFSTRLKELYELSESTGKTNREEMQKSLKEIRDENKAKLDEIRVLVDDKLKETLETRFNQSFKLISERLEQVSKGLGEMHGLAEGVGDLKRVLSNVKTRGNMGEVELGNILEQILSPEQYLVNACVEEDSQRRVEFAVKLPGSDPDGKPVLLPIDSKFPIEDYQRLLDAYDNGGDIEKEGARFEASVKKCAAEINYKYIIPPATTDFAIMFVPTEGLYAEILRRTGLFETLRREYKITVTGPANLAAFLSSLQMGFRTLAIEKRSSEVWKLLSQVKTEFTNFGDILDKTRKKLNEAANVIDSAGVRSRAIERRLRDVENYQALQE
ncbi:MAG: DNA recombination protein RmuC [Bacteroidales bacterium]|nr:DNA recombination protein RmuC [Bacteroidales bacterium]